MSFGKVGEDGQPVRRPPLQVTAKAAPAGGGLDKSFAALVFGVVIVAAGGALAAPPLFSFVQTSLFSGGARPINLVIAGLDLPSAKLALSREAFPDDAGRGFMTALAEKFPEDHDALLDRLAAAATKGADREALVIEVSEWTTSFAPSHLAAMGRTGADGFDKALALVSDALAMLEQTGERGCSVASLQKLASNPAAIAELGAYGSKGYKLGMRANRLMVDLAAAGRNAPRAETTLTRFDEDVLQNTFFSMMSDPQVMSLVQMSMQSGGASPDQIASNLNICQLGRTLVVKLKNLPAGTKARLWGMGTSQGGLSL